MKVYLVIVYMMELHSRNIATGQSSMVNMFEEISSYTCHCHKPQQWFAIEIGYNKLVDKC